MEIINTNLPWVKQPTWWILDFTWREWFTQETFISEKIELSNLQMYFFYMETKSGTMRIKVSMEHYDSLEKGCLVTVQYQVGRVSDAIQGFISDIKK